MKHKIMIVICLLTAISLAVLVGCSGQKKTEAPKPETKADVKTQDAQEGKTGLTTQSGTSGLSRSEPPSIFTSARNGDLEGVKKFLADGADVNTPDDKLGFTPLHWAAYRNRAEIAQFLIEKGANVNAKDTKGFAPLHRAAFFGHLDVARILIEKGADINLKDPNGLTPLFVAKKMQQAEFIKFLEEKGAQ